MNRRTILLGVVAAAAASPTFAQTQPGTPAVPAAVNPPPYAVTSRKSETMFTTFAQALHADHPASDRASRMALYAWLIGRWEMNTVVHADDATTHRGHGEIYADWVLDGRAIQDVWILPGFFYGTTLRIYDPGLDAWHILWSDPLKQYYARQIGRARGKDIVQEGRDDTGDATRWTFTDIMPNAFQWRGERSRDGGASWRLRAEFSVRRTLV
jgi:hypothetical protein